MTDLRQALQAATAEPAELDLGALRQRVHRLERRRLAVTGAVAGIAAVAVVGGVVGVGVLSHQHLGRQGAGQDTLTPARSALPPSPEDAPTTPTTGAPQTTPTGSAGPTPSASARSTPATGGSPSGPAFPADTRPDTATGSGRVLAVTGVRVAAQPGYDRVVLDLAADPGATAGWRVAYVEAPTADGSGAPLQVAGSAYLQVVVTGLDWTDPEAQRLSYAGGAVTPTGTALVRQVVPGTVFEGDGQFVIGTAARAPFRVFRLSDPARVVVDVRR